MGGLDGALSKKRVLVDILHHVTCAINLKKIGGLIRIAFSRASTTYRNGTCMTVDECEDKNGRSSGNCASG